MPSSFSRLLLKLFFVGIVLAFPITTFAQQPSHEEAFSGLWKAQEEYFRPMIRVERGEEGTLTAFLTGSAAEQGAPFSQVTVRGDSIFLQMEHVGVDFRGALSIDPPVIEGIWTQREHSAPISLVPVSASAAHARPQHPEPPYPYVVEDATIQTASDDVTLAGTLTRPAGAGPHPAVVLVSGSGPIDRDYEMSGHKPFLVLADQLTRQGMAVLRYDKRGVGHSSGSFSDASLEDFARRGGSAALSEGPP